MQKNCRSKKCQTLFFWHKEKKIHLSNWPSPRVEFSSGSSGLISVGLSLLALPNLLLQGVGISGSLLSTGVGINIFLVAGGVSILS